MKRWLLLPLAFLVAACAHLPAPTPPIVTPPPVYWFGLVACGVPVASTSPCPTPVVGASIGVNTGQGYDTKIANADGFALFSSSLPVSDVQVTAPHYLAFAVGIEPPKIDNQNLTLSLTRERPALPDAGEVGKVRVDGLIFRREDGSIFPWRGCTEFLGFKRFREEPDHGPLVAVLAERIAAGCNVFRVLGMVDSFAQLRPDGPAYYDDLSAFADFIGSLHARFEFVVFADAQIIMPRAEDEREHLEKVAGVLTSKPNAFIEVANEPFKNLPGGDATAAGMCRTIMGRGPPVASGAYTDWPPLQPCDYGTTHSDRKDEWPRTAKDLFDLRSVTNVPWVSDEPTGFAEVAVGDKRSTSADDAAYFAGTAALMGAGSTFHSDAGILSQPWGPVQLAAAASWYWAAQWVPTVAQLAPYMRGGETPGCHWLGESVAEHNDSFELRSFAKIVDGTTWLIQLRTVRPAVVPCGTWRVTSTPRAGFATLVQ